MSSLTEEKSPYFSKEFDISTVTSPKEYNGFLKRSVTIKYGNQDTQIIKNSSDIADVGHKSMTDELTQQWNALTSWAKDHNVVFIDEIRHRKNYVDEIINGKVEKSKRMEAKE